MQNKIWVGLFLLLSIGCAKPDSPASKGVQSKDGSERIYGGEAVSGRTSAERSVVAIYSEEDGGFLCSGTLISEQAVLTAAHCLSKNVNSSRVFFGRTVNKKTLSKAILAGVRHPNYNSKAKNNQADLAVVFFDGGLPQGYEPAALLEDSSALKAGKSVTMFGFGVDWILPGHNADKKGAGVLRQISLKIQNPRWAPGEVEIAQGFSEGTCNGDSGGPSFVTVNGISYFWGVGSRAAGYPLVPCAVDSIYTRVDIYREWIQQVLESHQQ